MENITLVKGQCSICGGPIDIKWAGENPSLGTKCQICSFKNLEPFTPEHVDFKVKTSLHFNPLFGQWNLNFNWKGTKILVNDLPGEITSTQADLAWVNFGKKGLTFEPIHGLGYWDLIRIYHQAGHSTTPPEYPYLGHKPRKARLLREPILPIEVNREGSKNQIRSVVIGSVYQPNFDAFEMLHAFCNVYVKHKFGLNDNYVI